ncbi:hypothetical protein [Serratia sp. 14-2641]|uniref:hypothetical protein n=1 Tax=Serratia sp. 14-2641 TaxID=1841657 RepID=UPI00080FE628|nr:hypothetical protein [Serratia sp. 14-2641]OCJ44114.1 hypothetical protein A6U95_19350 [Serratia sp. 14-2641]
MSKYRVVIEAPGLCETHEFDAESDRDAAMIARDIFNNTCNYGVSRVDGDAAAWEGDDDSHATAT